MPPCHECHKSNNDNAAFCVFCGRKIQQQYPCCAELHPLGAEFCQNTGRSIAVVTAEKAAENQRLTEINKLVGRGRVLRSKIESKIQSGKFIFMFTMLGFATLSIITECSIHNPRIKLWASTLGYIFFMAAVIGGFALGLCEKRLFTKSALRKHGVPTDVDFASTSDEQLAQYSPETEPGNALLRPTEVAAETLLRPAGSAKSDPELLLRASEREP